MTYSITTRVKHSKGYISEGLTAESAIRYLIQKIVGNPLAITQIEIRKEQKSGQRYHLIFDMPGYSVQSTETVYTEDEVIFWFCYYLSKRNTDHFNAIGVKTAKNVWLNVV